MDPTADTIAALSTPPGGAVRAVVRISGPRARAVAAALVELSGGGADGGALGVAREVLGAALTLEPFETRCLLLWMPGPGSYTGEDTAELHVPGAPPLVEALLARAFAAGCRAAAPGEFTRRAFENGRIDLTRAEGVAELTAAESEAERRAAVALLGGGLGRRAAELRDGLEELCALCEASLDFDESDTGHVPRAELLELGRAAVRRLEEARAFSAARAPERELPEVVLVGPPNAGKSTLFNALAGARALVSEIAGTTRDALSAELELGASGDRLPVRLVDLPGFEDSDDVLLAAGVGRAQERLERAALVLACVDGAGNRESVEAARARLTEQLPAAERLPRLWLWTRADLSTAAPPVGWLAVSGHTGAGLEALRGALRQALERGAGSVARAPKGGLGARHGRALDAVGQGLGQALEALGDPAVPLDLAAEHLRSARAPLDEVSGATSPEDLLDRIFARFCLGK